MTAMQVLKNYWWLIAGAGVAAWWAAKQKSEEWMQDTSWTHPKAVATHVIAQHITQYTESPTTIDFRELVSMMESGEWRSAQILDPGSIHQPDQLVGATVVRQDQLETYVVRSVVPPSYG